MRSILPLSLKAPTHPFTLPIIILTMPARTIHKPEYLPRNLLSSSG
jgi:hypothetical protein